MSVYLKMFLYFSTIMFSTILVYKYIYYILYNIYNVILYIYTFIIYFKALYITLKAPAANCIGI